MSSGIVELGKDIEDLLQGCWSVATKRAYASDVRHFLEWGGSVPASVPQVLAYVTQACGRLAPGTVRRRLVAIGLAHTLAGHENPACHEVVRLAVRALSRVRRREQQQARPVGPTELQALLKASGDGLRGVRNRAVVLLGFAAAMRRSELMALDIDDLEFCKEGVRVRISRSKTDQTGRGCVIGVPFGGAGLCAVAATRLWVDATGLRAGPLFRAINKSGRLSGRLGHEQVNKVLKQMAAHAGLPAWRLSGHSLRAGFVTSAARAGASLDSIQRQTRHASLDALARYIREAEPFANNANFALYREANGEQSPLEPALDWHTSR